tara:strand:- start:190 stop:351 length:162 start_codon:yes stop_codon:yes gene_type:complete
MSENAVGTGEAVAGTNPSDPSTPAAPMLFGTQKKTGKKLRELIATRIRTSQDK